MGMNRPLLVGMLADRSARSRTRAIRRPIRLIDLPHGHDTACRIHVKAAGRSTTLGTSQASTESVYRAPQPRSRAWTRVSAARRCARGLSRRRRDLLRAAPLSPSPAATIDPSSGCATRARSSRASGIPACRARSSRKSRIRCRYAAEARWSGWSASGMLEHHVDERASLEARGAEPLVEHVEDRQQLLARDRTRAAAPRPGASAWSTALAPLEEREHESCLEAKWRYIVCLATPERSMIASIPTAWMPRWANSSYAPASSRSRASRPLPFARSCALTSPRPSPESSNR